MSQYDGAVALFSRRFRVVLARFFFRLRFRRPVREYDAMCGIEFPRITKPLTCGARDVYARPCDARARSRVCPTSGADDVLALRCRSSPAPQTHGKPSTNRRALCSNGLYMYIHYLYMRI